jgi:hypothetical protein
VQCRGGTLKFSKLNFKNLAKFLKTSKDLILKITLCPAPEKIFK